MHGGHDGDQLANTQGTRVRLVRDLQARSRAERTRTDAITQPTLGKVPVASPLLHRAMAKVNAGKAAMWDIESPWADNPTTSGLKIDMTDFTATTAKKSTAAAQRVTKSTATSATRTASAAAEATKVATPKIGD